MQLKDTRGAGEEGGEEMLIRARLNRNMWQGGRRQKREGGKVKKG